MASPQEERAGSPAEAAPSWEPRARLLGERVARSLRLAPGRWELCAGSPEARPLLGRFLEGGAGRPRLLLVTLSPAGQLALGTELPAVPARGRTLFFLRGAPGAGALLCGDLPAGALEHFAALMEEVVAPILANEKNHRSWPHVVSQDIMRHVHSLKSNIFVVIGQVKGKTLLPLPAGSERMENADRENEKTVELVDKALVHAIESAVIDWSHQIQGALKRESSEPLLQGSSPTPKVELEFWAHRCEDLECIYDQLRAKKVRRMAELLERMQSSYFPAFQAMCRDVVEALTEARDISLHLAPLQRHVEDVEHVAFSKVKPLISPLLHVVCLIWATSSYYNTPARIIVLLQELGNLLIQQARSYLNPEDILKGEAEESLGKVREALGTLSHFKETFEARRDDLHSYSRPGQAVKQWDFPSLLVFARLDGFLRRLEMVEDLLATALDILKLEKLEFGGIRGKALSQQVLGMYEEFQEVYKVLSDRSDDCLDTSNVAFEREASAFKRKVEDLDRRLGTIFGQALEDAAGLEHAFKLLDMFGSLLERPVIAASAADKYPRLISMFDRELDDAKLIYSRHAQEERELGLC